MPLPQVSKASPGIREVLGTPPARVAEPRLESPIRHGVARRSIAGPSPGRGIRGRRFRSPSRIAEGRLQALQALYEEAGEHKLASEITAL